MSACGPEAQQWHARRRAASLPTAGSARALACGFTGMVAVRVECYRGEPSTRFVHGTCCTRTEAYKVCQHMLIGADPSEAFEPESYLEPGAGVRPLPERTSEDTSPRVVRKRVQPSVASLCSGSVS